MDSVWEENGAVLLVDAGDLFGLRNINERHQTEFLCDVTSGFGYDAIGLGEMDLDYGREFLRRMIQEHDLPFTNANVRLAGTGELLLPEYIITEKNGIKFGICSVLGQDQPIQTMTDKDADYEVQDPVAVLRDLVPRLRKQVDTVVLLAHVGDNAVLGLLGEVAGIDLAVLGHSHRNLATEKVVANTPLMCSVHEGRYIGRSNLLIASETGEVKAFDVTSISLDDGIVDNEEMAARVTAYKESLQDFKLARRAAFPQNKGSDKEQFLQQGICRKCHADAWDAFAKSAHKRAYATLRDKGRNFDPECLVCHVTGYEWKGGYGEEPPRNRLTDVQCEACHGYGTEHSRDGKWAAQAKDSCIVCHDKENSPNFDYATYWEKIKH